MSRLPLWNALPLLLLGALAGCERDPVEHEMKDLQQARENSPEVVDELESQLEEERAEVDALEKELDLAKRRIARMKALFGAARHHNTN